MRACVLLLAGALFCAGGLVGGGCKKSPDYDRSSPEKTLQAFFAALDDGRLPEDLGLFIGDDRELTAWKLRCRAGGCKSGKLTIHETADASDYAATVIASYTIYNRDNLRMMRGKRSPIRLRRDGDVWRLTQFGRRITVSPSPQPARDGGVADAAPTEDAASTGGADATESQ